MSKNRDGYFRATFYYKGKQYVATGKTQREADKKAALKLDKLERGEVGISGKMTVGRWAEEWLETYKRPATGDKQYGMYLGMVKNAIVSEIGSLQLDEVTVVHLQKILNRAAGKSSSHANKLRNTLRSMFKVARTSRLINYDPAETLALPKTTNGSHRSLTEIEREHFLKVADTHHAGLMFKTMLYSGLRTGEVVALDWRDIDFNKRRLCVSKSIESGSNNIKTPKTEAGARIIPITDEIYYDLLKHKGEPFSPVFVQERGEARHTESSRKKAWNSIKKQMDISMGARFEKQKSKDGKMRMKQVLSVVAPDLVPYCLRHTFCTDLQDKGVPINIAKYLMGHKYLQVTAGTYTHTTDEAIDCAAALMSKPRKVINGNKQYNGNKRWKLKKQLK